MKTVSVIIPYFNSENTVIRALQSVVNQTFNDYEIVLVDDGSTDNSYNTVYGFMEKYGNIDFKHYRQKNTGPSDARNLGVSKSNARYLAFLDADDDWVKNKLEIQIKTLVAHDIDLLGSNINIIDENKIVAAKYFVKKNLQFVNFYKLLFRHYYYTSSVVVKRNVFSAVGGFPPGQRYAEDTLFFARITRLYRAAVINDFLVNVYKPLFGAVGLSANLRETNKYELNNYDLLRKENAAGKNKIHCLLYHFLLLFTQIKYFRKIFITNLRKLTGK